MNVAFLMSGHRAAVLAVVEPVAADLPALVGRAVVGVVLVVCQLLVMGRGDGLDDQLGVGVGWLGIILDTKQQTKTRVSVSLSGWQWHTAACVSGLNLNLKL